MNPPDQGIRKAAILVASLDRATADAMLDVLGPEQAALVRQTMVALGKIDSREQRRVIEEFFRVGPRSFAVTSPSPTDGKPDNHPPGVELDGPLARKLATPQAPSAPGQSAPALAAPALATPSPANNARPFRFLYEAEGEKLTRVLAGERPQTIALVLSHLSPEQAAGVLARLQPALQVDVIRRLVDLEETDPEILREVERALQSRLSQQVHMQCRRVAGLKAVSGILEASDGQLAQQILGNLAAHDQPLAEKLNLPAMEFDELEFDELEFDELVRLDDAALKAIFQAAEPKLAMTALVGAPPKLIDRVLGRFAAPEAKTVRHKLNHPGPIQLSDVEAARQQVADLARRLAWEGRIQLTQREAVVVA